MDEVKLDLAESGKGAFYLMDGGTQIGEMDVAIKGKDLTVYHTEVSTKAEGKGRAHKLLTAMVEYARNRQLKVIPLCPYVLAQFKRHPELYSDVWSEVQGKKN